MRYSNVRASSVIGEGNSRLDASRSMRPKAKVLYYTDFVYGRKVSLLRALNRLTDLYVAFDHSDSSKGESALRGVTDQRLEIASILGRKRVFSLDVIRLKGNFEIPRLRAILRVMRMALSLDTVLIDDAQTSVDFLIISSLAAVSRKKRINMFEGTYLGRYHGFLPLVLASMFKQALRIILLRGSLILPASDGALLFARQYGLLRGANPSVTAALRYVDSETFHPDTSIRRRKRKELGLSDEDLVVLYVGGFREVKGFDVLARVFLNNKVSRWKLVVVRYGRAFADLVQSLAKCSNVLYIDPVPYSRMPELYQASDVVVVPSTIHEGGVDNAPNVVAEAMASGCAVVCSSSGGIPSMAGDAALYFQRDNSQDLYEKLSFITEANNLTTYKRRSLSRYDSSGPVQAANVLSTEIARQLGSEGVVADVPKAE